MKKATKLSLIMIALALVAAVTGIFAYFSHSNEAAPDPVRSGEVVDVVVNITNENDLRVASFDVVFQAKGVTNTSEVLRDGKLVPARKVLKLTSNIKLTSSLVIESDINIDFNGKTIDTNGFNLTIRHNYMSNLTLFNGAVVNSSAAASIFYIEVNNATVYFDRFTCTFVEEVYDFYKVAQEIFAHLAKTVQKYHVDDLPLLFQYKHYPITFIYTSERPQIVDNLGRVNRAANSISVPISLQISSGENFASYNFEVIIVGTESGFLDAGLDIIDSYFERYKFTKNEFGQTDAAFSQMLADLGITAEKPYIYYNEITLITQELFNYEHLYNYTYSLSGTSPAGALNAYEGTLSPGQKSGVVELIVDIYLADPADSGSIGTKIGSKTYTFYYVNNYDIAEAGILDVGVIVIESPEDEIPLWSDFFTPALNLLSVNVKIKNAASQSLFTIVTIDGKPHLMFTEGAVYPEENPHISLIYTFTFKNGAPLTIEKEMGIYLFIPSDGGALGLSGLERLYYILLGQFNDQLNVVHSFGDFTMSNEYWGTKIRYEFIIDQRVTTKYPYATAENIFIQKSELFEFGIKDITCIPPENVPVTIKIFFTGDNGVESEYSKSIAFTLPGVLSNVRPGAVAADIPDAALYQFMLTNFDIDHDGILKVDEVLLSSRTYFLVEGIGQTITSLKGMEYLKTVSIVIFDNVRFGTSANIDQMLKPQIVQLVLHNCGLETSFLSQLSGLYNLASLDLSDNDITGLAPLPVLPSLVTLDLTDNPITSYDKISIAYGVETLKISYLETALEPLMELKNLKRVYITGNAAASANPVPMNEAFYPANIINYVSMQSSGIEFFYNGAPVKAPSADDVKYAVVLHAIFYVGESRTIQVPISLLLPNDGFYPLTWKYVDASGAEVTLNSATTNISVKVGETVSTATVSYNAANNNLINISALPKGAVINLRVTVTDAITTVMREIKIIVN